MKTKNLFLGLSLLAIAGWWTGCSNDNEVIGKQRAIGFRAQGGTPELRTTTTTREYVNAFVVSGSDDEFTMNTPLFENFSIARDIYGEFDYNPKQYYHDKATAAKFFAYSPVSQWLFHNDLSGEAGADASDLLEPAPEVKFYYELPMLDYENGTTTQEDLLVAWTEIDEAAIIDTESSFNMVPFNFVHALSRVFVTGQNQTAFPVRITNLQFNNLYIKGSAVVKGTTTGKTGGTDLTDIIEWTGTGTKSVNSVGSDPQQRGDYRYELPESGVALAASSAHGTPSAQQYLVAKEQGMMVIPQELVPSTDPDEFAHFSLRVNYELSNLTVERFIKVPSVFSFEPGKQYLINIVFSGREINFGVSVAEFGNPETVAWTPVI